MSRFGDLLAGNVSAPPVASPPVEEPVVEAPGTPASVEPDIAPPPVPPVTVDDIPDVSSTPAPTYADLKGKSKYDLEQIGRTIGIELDRRQSHNKLVDQLLEAFANQ